MSGYSIVYYKKNSSDIDVFSFPNELSKEKFDNDYKYVMPVLADSLEEIYSTMQGENWSPNGEARELVLALGLSHTSMSMGDIVFDPDSGNYWVCDSYGFKHIHIL